MPVERLVLSNAKEMCHTYFSNYYIPHIGRPARYETFEKKNLKYFINVAEKFSIRDGFNQRAFIKSAMRGEYRYPAQLNFEYLWNNYIEEIALLKQEYEEEQKRKEAVWDSPELKLTKRVVNFFKMLNGRTIQDIANNPFLEMQMYEWNDLCVACFSETFIGSVDISEENIKIEQSNVKKYPRVFNKIKEKLGDDFKEV